jgi:type I restriction enzyme, S subunit
MKNGWPTKMLADVCEVFADGDWVESKDQSPNGIRLIQTGNVGQGVFKARSEKARYISEATFKRLRCTEIFEGDCLISRLPDPVGRSCILPDTGERMITAVDCTIVRFNPKQLLPAFFNFYTQSLDYLKAVDSATTGTTRNRISRSNLGLIQIPVPLLPEQQRIVGILDEAFEGITIAKDNAEKNLQNARVLFESHLQSVFTQRGAGWVETTLDKISTNLDSKRVPITKSDRKSGEYPYYGASGIVDYVAEYIFEGDTLLVSEDGANLLARSTPIAFSVSGKYWVNNHAHILKFENMTTQRFVEFYLGSVKLDEYIRGAAQPKLTQTALNSIPIPIPQSVAEQEEIVEGIELLSEETQRLASLYERKLAALEALKKSLLHQAFTGKL